MGKHAQYGKVAPAIQYGAEGSVLQNLPSRVHPAENLLKQAVWWIDAAHESAGSQTITNLGWGGAALNAQAGSTTGADSNDPKYLSWEGENYVYLPGVAGNYLSVPDEAALDITGDIDLRLKVAMDDWTPAIAMRVLNKFNSATNNASYSLKVDTDGKLSYQWSPDGTTAATIQKTSTVATAFADGTTHWLRVTHDVDNGAAGNDVKFYTSDDGVTWTQLGTTITTAGVASIFSGAAGIEVGARNAGTTEPSTGSFYRAIVKNGIDGPTVLDVDCSQITSGSATSFTALTGQTVTINRTTSGRKAVAVTQPCWLFGTDDTVVSPTSSLLNISTAESLTVMWAGRMPNVTSSYQRLVGRGSGYPSYFLDFNAGSLRLVLGDGTDIAVASHTAPAATHVSLFGVLDRPAATARLVLNNTVNAVSSSLIDGISSAAAVYVSGTEGLAYADCETYAAAVWRRALTPTEMAFITDYYQARAE